MRNNEKLETKFQILISYLRSSNDLTFFEAVYKTARSIPKGKVTTYSTIAKFIGYPRASRAVGWAMRACSYSDVPCHRVVRADGLVSGFPDDVEKRIKELRRERIPVRKRRIVNFDRYFYDDLK